MKPFLSAALLVVVVALPTWAGPQPIGPQVEYDAKQARYVKQAEAYLAEMGQVAHRDAALATLAYVAGSTISLIRHAIRGQRRGGPDRFLSDLVSHALRCLFPPDRGRVSPP